MTYILCYGNNRHAPAIARDSGALYGVRYDTVAYEQPHMIDGGLKTRWTRWKEVVRRHKPTFALVPDFFSHMTIVDVELYVMDARRLSIPLIGVTPKFDGALEQLHDLFGDSSDIVYCISVPSKYAGYLPDRYIPNIRYHMLGGRIDDQIQIARDIARAGGIPFSADGNAPMMAMTKRNESPVPLMTMWVSKWDNEFGNP